MERMNTASSLYQMYKEIVDVSFLTKKGYVYFEDVPLAMLLKDVSIGRRRMGGGEGRVGRGDKGGGGSEGEPAVAGGGREGGGGGGEQRKDDENKGFWEKEEDEISTEASAGNVLHPHRPREFFTLGMEWGEDFYGPEVLHHSTDPRRNEGHELFLHPVLRKYRLALNNATGKLHYEPYAVVHLAEDLATAFTHPLNHLKWVKQFFADAVKANKAQVDKQAEMKRVMEEGRKTQEDRKRRVRSELEAHRGRSSTLDEAESDDEHWRNPLGL